MSALGVRGLTKKYGTRTVLNAIDLELRDGSFNFLLGASGSGKSTLLRMIAGLLAPDAGEIRIGDVVVADPASRVPPEKRGVAMVFQHDALWPHMSVAQHLAFARGRHGAAAEDARLLQLTRLAGLEDRLPTSLSGGERQRLSLARALAIGPRVLLMDEPTRNLDRPLARAVRAEFEVVLRNTGTTVLYVTHDPEEAFSLADRLLVLGDGRIVGDGPPEDLARTPPNAAVAEMLAPGARYRGVADAQGRAATPLGAFAAALTPGKPFTAFFRAHDFVLDEAGIRARVLTSRYLGADRELLLEIDGSTFAARVESDSRAARDQVVGVRVASPPAVFAEEDA